MDDGLQEIIDEFIAESKEGLEDIETELLLLEECAEGIDEELINKIFRAVHSIKGAAGFLGFTSIGALSHGLESVLDLVRSALLMPDANTIDVLLKAADRLGSLLDDTSGSNGQDVAEQVAQLQAILDTVQERPAPVEPKEKALKTTEPIAAAGDGPEPTDAKPASPEPQRHEANVRVPVALLDDLMNLAGELVLSRNQFLQALAGGNQAALGFVASRLDQVTSELQEAVMQTRMQPMGNVFGKFPRVVRDLSHRLGKRCSLVIEGNDVELDKSLIETIGAPLTHLVRNSVDHGIETPAERARANKMPEGRIELRAFHQGGKVHVSITDDGAGIDPDKLRDSAVEKHLLGCEEANALSDREALDLIFAPGFSTAEDVTDVSGRGVGMDVVRSNLASLGGNVNIESECGKGTTVEIDIPLTLAILAAIVVDCGEQRFAIPQANIRELVRVRGDEVRARIKEIKGHEVLRLRGQLLPIVRLSRLLGLEDADTAEDGELDPDRPQSVIVVESSSLRFGIVVESQIDAEEIVAKPLGRHVKSSVEIAGATILGDGRVAMILDVAGIAARIQLRSSDFAAPESSDIEHHVGRERLVLFQNGQDYFALMAGLVQKIERVTAADMKQVGDQLVYERRGHSIPLLRLEDWIKASDVGEQDPYWVLVIEEAGREVGILVAALEDICELEIDLDGVTLTEPGVIGSFLRNGNHVRLIDSSRIAEQAFPRWFTRPAEGTATHRRRILLAEDTATFRRLLTGYFQESGYDVHACVDGEEAWEMLTSEGFEVDVIVSDIAMPRLDGMGLARRVRADDRLREIPMIALSSLSSETDIQAGEAAGFDDYQVKLDRHSMLASIGRALKVECK